jgi:hypothetical protein
MDGSSVHDQSPGFAALGLVMAAAQMAWRDIVTGPMASLLDSAAPLPGKQVLKGNNEAGFVWG